MATRLKTNKNNYMAGNLELIKKLREASGAGISACQKALKECGDDYDKAFDFLRKQGISKASLQRLMNKCKLKTLRNNPYLDR